LARRLRKVSPGLVLLVLVSAIGTIGLGAESPTNAQAVDPLEPLLDYRPAVASVVRDRQGQTIGEFFVQRRRLVGLDELPEHVVQAFVASEDGRFFEHNGLDMPAILRAAWTNLLGGRIEQGASTITQQTVKNVLLTPERTWWRKVREVLLALEVERRLSKQEILLVYLNHIYLGNGSYGVGDAALSYFGKDVSDLDVSEAALLAGLPQRPSAYSPKRHPEAAEVRRLYVLGQMLDRGFITAEAHDEAVGLPPRIVTRSRRPGSSDAAAYFTEEVRRELVERLGTMNVYRAGLTVETTLDLDLQRSAVAAMRKGLEDLDRRQGWRGPLRSVPEHVVDLALQEVGAENGTIPWHLPTAPQPGGRRWLGVVLDIGTDETGREMVSVGLAPGVIALAEVDPRDWGRSRAPEGAASVLLHPGDVAWFGLHWAPADGEKDTSRGDLGELRAELHQEPAVEGALLSLDVATGEVLAMVGGYDFGRSEFNRAVQARRQPGSAFKPFVFASAIEAGYTQASFVLDSPHMYWDETQQSLWRPQNYGRRFLGWLTLRRALARSVNNAALHLARRVGVENVMDMARRLGVNSVMHGNLSLALGSSEVSLLELTRAYAAFPAGGRRVHTHFIRRVYDRHGKVILDDIGLDPDAGWPFEEHAEAQAVSPQVARVVTDLLRGAVEEPGATGAKARKLDGVVAGKTGTTNGNRDAWFVGFSPDAATGVWVGFDRPRSLGARETGGRAALPIWVDYMDAALAKGTRRDFDVPEGVVFARVDSRTGRLGASSASWQAFLAGSEPIRAAWRKREKRSARRELMRDIF